MIKLVMTYELKGDTNNPYHLSVGAVVIKNKKIALIKKPDGYCTLPQETLFLNENLKAGLIRGIKEELGEIVNIKKYLGSLKSYFFRPNGTKIEKTTLYFLAKATSTTKKQQQKDELKDKILWLNKKQITERLKQSKNNETKILEKLTLYDSRNHNITRNRAS